MSADRDMLATEFTAAIPDYVVSMASIQGHLMLYKTHPHKAVRTAVTFIEGERAKAIYHYAPSRLVSSWQWKKSICD